MTDKEWNELCDWAKGLKSKNVCITRKGFSDHSINITIKDYVVRMRIDNNGWLYSRSYNIISENRTPQQIKAIIESLL